VIAEAASRFGTLRGLVNCAGLSDPPVGGLVPQTQQSLLLQALRESWAPKLFNQRLQEHQQKREA